jgi:hypothetical protein
MSKLIDKQILGGYVTYLDDKYLGHKRNLPYDMYIMFSDLIDEKLPTFEQVVKEYDFLYENSIKLNDLFIEYRGKVIKGQVVNVIMDGIETSGNIDEGSITQAYERYKAMVKKEYDDADKKSKEKQKEGDKVNQWTGKRPWWIPFDDEPIGILNVPNKLARFVQTLPQELIYQFDFLMTEGLSFAGNGIKKGWDSFVSLFDSVRTSVGNSFHEGISFIKDSTKNLLDGVMSSGKDVGEYIRTELGKWADMLKLQLKEGVVFLGDAINSSITKGAEVLGKSISTVVKPVNDTISAITPIVIIIGIGILGAVIINMRDKKT